MTMVILKLNFMLNVVKIKDLNIIDLFFIFSEMDDVNKNKIRDYFYRYWIKETKENFEKLANIINKNKYLKYEQIFNLIENCQTIKNDNCGLVIEIDSEENKHLLNDLTKIFFTRKLGQKRVEKKIGHGYEVGNLFIKILIHKV